ncbi:NACHT, LRR and PYD domains-containing protein 12-like [Notechis scutatus]|uniref:NACHT, LRR and PYD domains-containing protein 12-like n=1 Tax=Notechis scutatus TaxID=8663 RepID=A0A6J1W5B8_9SAUR|nr:NACHT, LRR and PYD domains-containing protein 12-like [Notechis scutatus]
MELLCDGLKHPECTIAKLRVDVGILAELFSSHLAEVLRKNQRLRELDLSFRNPHEKTMELLCEGLKHPECTIAKLRLDVNILTESCSRHLADIFRKNQRLRELDLSLRNPDEKTMELLCDGLKHPACTVVKLRFDVDILTELFSRHLAEVLRKNQRLKELDLSLKNPDEKTMELLCDGLKHPECTIANLRFYGVMMNELFSSHLAEVLRKNQRLRELDLSFRNPHEKTMELLCEGLKHPECTIAKLRYVFPLSF